MNKYKNAEREKCMQNDKVNILVVGNGFDLAHGLPTKYSDFLEFIKILREILFENKQNIDYCKIPSLKSIIEEDRGNKRDNLYSKKGEWEILIKSNLWIDYFIENPLYKKENWIDFESEIYKVIKTIHRGMLEKKLSADSRVESLGIMFFENVFLNNYENKKSLMNGYELEEGTETITYEQISECLLRDLNKLIRALELYLTRYVAKIPVEKKLPDIVGLEIKQILSFNYTDTYSRVYAGACEHFCDYIHGKAKEQNTIESNNMVVGIDEYLNNDIRDEDITFVAFRKFYQRIYKETGCIYKYWLDRINTDKRPIIQELIEEKRENGKVLSQTYRDVPKYNIYILGHSLDVTDRDVLRDILLNDKARIVIFYHNDKHHAQLIKNLVKVIGQDELIKRTGGRTKTIFFEKQKELQ